MQGFKRNVTNGRCLGPSRPGWLLKSRRSMIKVNTLCNEMGLDVDAAGGAIGWAMECYSAGNSE